MHNAEQTVRNELGVKEICLQVGVWGALVIGFLAVCIIAPMLALNL